MSRSDQRSYAAMVTGQKTQLHSSCLVLDDVPKKDTIAMVYTQVIMKTAPIA